MTMPSLIQNNRKAEATSRLKKFVSVINQALIFAENDYGMRADWEIGEMNSQESSYNFLFKYIKPYIKSFEIEKSYFNSIPTATLKFVDGSLMYIKIGACYDIYYDINGERRPNEKGRDIFVFILCKNKGCRLNSDQVTGYWCSADEDRPSDKARLNTLCKNNPTGCTMLLEDNQWEFPKDYPIKL